MDTVADIDTPWAWLKATNNILINPPFQEPLSFPVQLTSRLFLSDMPSVRDVTKLNALGITHVLTTNKLWSAHDLERIRSRYDRVGIAHCAVSGEDEADYDMLGRHWEACREFIHRARRHQHGKVVVHCVAGQNRSALIAAAAMLTAGEEERNEDATGSVPSLLSVIRELKARRGIVLTNLGFQRQLCIFAAKEGRLGDRPEGYTDDPLPESNFLVQTARKLHVKDALDPFDSRSR
uniref:Uncharacterized protein n=1 Tax=Corethron hystrix TaxID=216773 RepID=A0A6U5ISX2_9STRA|mmetsp:Transcript_3490/g.6461  ORF Transcript_3490/g.6461 Transcript_3490/m.6461 type:complete len:236 (+) Transcript_3490:137-844(+)|eukprot:CAMPEP_0113313230 /NCGR_PEP_ID=MMETSP0010_2-20120614/9734_1 /TAXON_ID=216773 ORGANISM="Corethron hystrix, Strain 308" /NCGR_SAMPLE_ID=MMETSP0010_2 /ASSEMBLY_ACC=CAM_ASM_000155 /LENGTH=235 /DNA_ID=CAMNT_0000169195 /DNA_START=97 /DNA_END=804 /DNA_ORIENTATION=+ /assembly_acc=CAM_ASM_000155